jgi:hypothetical protein
MSGFAKISNLSGALTTWLLYKLVRLSTIAHQPLSNGLTEPPSLPVEVNANVRETAD